MTLKHGSPLGGHKEPCKVASSRIERSADGDTGSIFILVIQKRTMKKILLALFVIGAMFLTTVPARAKEAKALQVPRVSWSQAQYYPNDTEVSLLVKYAGINNPRVEVIDYQNLAMTPVTGTKTVRTGGNHLSVTFKNPRKSGTYRVRLTSKSGDVSTPYATTRLRYDMIDTSFVLHGTPDGVKEGETRTIVAEVFYPNRNVTYSIQRKSARRWIEERKVSHKRDLGHKFNIKKNLRIKFPSKPGRYRYRVVVTSDYAPAAVQHFTIRVMKQKKYAKYLKSARAYSQRFCPGTPVYVSSNPYKVSDSAIATTFFKDRVIGLRKGIPRRYLRAIMDHECSHILQLNIMKNAPAKVASQYRKKAAKVYKHKQHSWIEVEASCMALVKSKKNLIYSPYIRKCTSAQYAMAKKTIRLGVKYRN